MPWTVVGDDVWVENATFVSYPHPLAPAQWPKSSSGAVLSFSNISTLRGSMAELEDDSVRRAQCRLSYQATSGWLPWMLMGQVPGSTIWRGQGKKLNGLDEMPGASRAAFERIHPEIFTAQPWSGKKVMFLEYAKARGGDT
jgi:hypothetical protein